MKRGGKVFLDYLEGLCLGTAWSDTDYANRKHLTSFFVFGLIVSLMFAFYVFFGRFSLAFTESVDVKMILFVLLFLGAPFLSFQYYKFPIYLKIPILALQFLKILLAVSLILSLISPKINVELADVQSYVMEFANRTLETSVARFARSAGTFSTVIGVVMGGVYMSLLAILIVFGALIAPGIMVLALRALQFGYDFLIARFVLKKYVDR